MKLSDIAARLGHPVEGDGRVEIHHISSLEEAGPGDLTFLASAKHAKKAEATKASAIIVGPGAGALPIPVIRAPDAYLAFAHALEVLYPRPKPTPGVHPLASIAKSARIGPGASIAPFAVIEDDVEIGKDAEIGPHVVIRRGARIGDSVLLHSRVVIREGCRLGHRVIIQDGTVIGADGFGFTKRPDGSHQKIPQVGIVVLEDDVEVQANTCIDRATLGATKIGRGTKIDNLVQVGHNCATGENSIVCSQVGMSGSTILGKSVTLGGQCGMAGHQKIGDGVTASARSGVPNDVEPGKHIAGFVAIDSREWLRYQIALPRLPDVMKDVRELRKRLETLEESKPSEEGLIDATPNGGAMGVRE